VHYPNPVGNNKPITIGHNYAALVHVDLAGPSTWAPPWALERTPTNWRGVDLALEQIVHLVRCDDEWHVVAADSRYGTPSYIAGLHQCPNVTGVTRLRSPRNEFPRKVVAVGHYNGFWNETDDWVGENPFVSQIRCSVCGSKTDFPRKLAMCKEVRKV